MTIQEYIELETAETGDCELLQEVEESFHQVSDVSNNLLEISR